MKEYEWDFTAEVRGTIYASTREEAIQNIHIELGRGVSVVDVVDLTPVDLDED